MEKPKPSATQPENNVTDEKFNVQIVGISERSFRAHAIEEANRRLNAATSGEGFIGILKSIRRGEFKKVPKQTVETLKQSVKGGIGREVVLGKNYHQARQEMVEEQNLKLHEGGESTDYEAALLYRFGEAADQYEDLIQESNGEKRFSFDLGEAAEDNEGSEVGNEVRMHARELISQAVRGDFDNEDGSLNSEALNEASKAFLFDVASHPQTEPYLNFSELQVNNLYQVALALRSKFTEMQVQDPSAELGDLLDKTTVTIGEAQVGSFVESDRSFTEKITEKLSRIPFLNPESIAIGVGTGMAVGQWAKKRALVGALAAGGAAAVGGAPLITSVAALGAGSALLGAMRGRTAARQEHIMRARRAARGEQDPLNGVGLFSAETFTEVTEKLNLLYDKDGNLRQDDLESTMQIFAEANARLALSIQNKNGDYIIEDTTDPNGPKREQQYSEFLVALSKVKADLRIFIDDALDKDKTDILDKLKIKPEFKDKLWEAPDTLQAIIDPIIAGEEGALELDVLGELDRDTAEAMQAQKKLARSGAMRGMIIGATAAVIGSTAGHALEHAISSGLELGNHAVNPDIHPVDTQISPNSHVVAPEGVTISGDNLGNYTVNTLDGSQINNLHFQANGALSDESIKTLADHHINASTNFENQTIDIPEQSVTVTPDQLNQVVENMPEIRGNNTQIVDGVNRNWITPSTNEKLLYSPHLEDDGSITIDTSHIQTNPGEKVEIGFTASTETGDKMLILTPDENGIAHINKGDLLYQTFHPTSEGSKEMEFSGRWTQAIIDKGAGPNGEHNINVLATDIGSSQESLNITIPAHPAEVINTTTTLTLEQASPQIVEPNTNLQWQGMVVPTSFRVRRGLDLPQSQPNSAAPTTQTPIPTPIPTPAATSAPGGSTAASPPVTPPRRPSPRPRSATRPTVTNGSPAGAPSSANGNTPLNAQPTQPNNPTAANTPTANPNTAPSPVAPSSQQTTPAAPARPAAPTPGRPTPLTMPQRIPAPQATTPTTGGGATFGASTATTTQGSQSAPSASSPEAAAQPNGSSQAPPPPAATQPTNSNTNPAASTPPSAQQPSPLNNPVTPAPQPASRPLTAQEQREAKARSERVVRAFGVELAPKTVRGQITPKTRDDKRGFRIQVIRPDIPLPNKLLPLITAEDKGPRRYFEIDTVNNQGIYTIAVPTTPDQDTLVEIPERDIVDAINSGAITVHFTAPAEYKNYRSKLQNPPD